MTNKVLQRVDNAVGPEDYLDGETGELLNPKHELFAGEFVNCFNAPQALVNAGYPAEGKTDKQLARASHQVLAKPEVQLRIRNMIRDRVNLTGIGPDWVVMKWMELHSRCMQAEQVLDHEGNPTGEYRFDSRGAGNALDSMAKYFGMFTKSEKDGMRVVLNVNFGDPGGDNAIEVQAEDAD